MPVVVSYTGKFDVSLLQQVDTNSGSAQIAPNPTNHLTILARQARDRLRWAESVKRTYEQSGSKKKPSSQELKLLQELKSGKLRAEANEATRKSGWGRIKHEDGSFEEITPHRGGIVRSILDKVQADLLCVQSDGTQPSDMDEYGFVDYDNDDNPSQVV